jgi:DNA-directed RNA polymerase specialized sigma24 family protein
MLDVLHKMPCDEDFERYRTRVRTDFFRKWYHTRSKKVQSVSLEKFRAENWDSEDDRLFYLPDPRLHLEEYVCAKVDAERFLKSLPEKERRIVQMRDEGYSYMEIAAALGFANHSSVIKRMEGIKKKYRNYMEA